MNMVDNMIKDLFSVYWTGPETESLELAKKQLLKNLNDQVNGYWSGHSAYKIMTNGGFLVDEKHINGKGKRLTELGRRFVESMSSAYNGGEG